MTKKRTRVNYLYSNKNTHSVFTFQQIVSKKSRESSIGTRGLIPEKIKSSANDPRKNNAFSQADLRLSLPGLPTIMFFLTFVGLISSAYSESEDDYSTVLDENDPCIMSFPVNETWSRTQQSVTMNGLLSYNWKEIDGNFNAIINPRNSAFDLDSFFDFILLKESTNLKDVAIRAKIIRKIIENNGRISKEQVEELNSHDILVCKDLLIDKTKTGLNPFHFLRHTFVIINSNDEIEAGDCAKLIKYFLSKGVYYRNMQLDLINLLIENNPQNKELSQYVDSNSEIVISYVATKLSALNFNDTIKILSICPNISTEILKQQLIDQGTTTQRLELFLNFFKLIRDFNNGHLSDFEASLISSSIEVDSISVNTIRSLGQTNKQGFNILHLLLIAGKFKAVRFLINNGIQIDTRAFLISTVKKNTETTKFLLSKAKDIDFDTEINDEGETLEDLVMDNDFEDIWPLVQDQIKSKLFYFMRSSYDCGIMLHNRSKVNIAITITRQLWSTEYNQVARNAKLNDDDLEFYLMPSEAIANCRNILIDSLDAWINPGAGDHYPLTTRLFSLTNVSLASDPEKTYQQVLDITEKNDIPYFGACAGVQHLALYHGGMLYKSEFTGDVMSFKPGSFTYYMAMSPEQQKKSLESCSFDPISFQGDRAHSFTVSASHPGTKMQVDALSEDAPNENGATVFSGVMAISHENGIRFGTQFHPEGYYRSNQSTNNHQRNLIDNFFKLARMHRNYRNGQGEHPIKHMMLTRYRLDECLSTAESTNLKPIARLQM